MALNALFRRAALAVPRAAPSLLRSARTPVARRFASPAAPATSHSSGGAYDGFDIHPPAKALVVEAKLWGALAWFWIFYQLHNNWDVMLGYRHAFEHKGEHASLDDDELPDGTSASGGHGHH